MIQIDTIAFVDIQDRRRHELDVEFEPSSRKVNFMMASRGDGQVITAQENEEASLEIQTSAEPLRTLSDGPK